jgi:hypothetical protein
MAAVYRINQALRALLACSQPVERTLAAEYLSPELLILFDQMRRSEQLHALNVLRMVLAQGSMSHDLAVAALLHDVGKSRYTVRIWQKTLAVVVSTIAPGLFDRWSRGSPERFWQRPFVAKAQHPQWSADMIAAAGASETAVWLVAHHQQPATTLRDHSHHHLLRRLQLADDAN